MIGGMQIQSDILLPGIAEQQEKELPDITIQRGVNDREILEMAQSKEEICCDFLYNCNKSYGVVFKPEVIVAKVEERKRIYYELLNNSDSESVKQLLIFVCLIMTCVQMDMIFMQGSCIQVKDKTFIIGGEAGVEKSSFITKLLSNQAEYLSDKVCAIKFGGGVPVVQSASKYTTIDEKYISCQREGLQVQEKELNGIIMITPIDTDIVSIEEIEQQQKGKMIIDGMLYRNLYACVESVQQMHQQITERVKDIPMYRFYCPVNRETGKNMLEVFEEYFQINKGEMMNE